MYAHHHGMLSFKGMEHHESVPHRPLRAPVSAFDRVEGRCRQSRPVPKEKRSGTKVRVRGGAGRDSRCRCWGLGRNKRPKRRR